MQNLFKQQPQHMLGKHSPNI